MKKFPIYLLLAGSLIVSCQKDDSPNPGKEEDKELAVEQFIFRGMEEFYLYEDQVPEFQDGFFDSEEHKNTYLSDFESPEELFSTLMVPEDNFSYMTDDYHALNDQFDGKSGATGIEYGLGLISNSDDNVFGFITYVLPKSSAEEAGLSRGTIFTEIDGTPLTEDNFFELVSQKSFTINIAYFDENNQIALTDETATLEDRPYTANPVFLHNILEIDDTKIGYLMYNSFIGDFDDELNSVFADFKAANINHLILDLRYNGGGSVSSAVSLASMITGQFEGEIFMKEQWNDKYQTYFETHSPETILNYFESEIRTGETINNLNLTEVFILSGYQTASASELIINGLEPYINVIQVGETTTGKYQGSITLYDEPGLLDEEKANPDHTYAIQPLVFKTANAVGKTDYRFGLNPDIELNEDLANLGTLGDPSEPLLKAALDRILGRHQTMRTFFTTKENFRVLGGKELFNPKVQRMYKEKIPTIPTGLVD